jgi:polyisoprenoid-binding protein YceI
MKIILTLCALVGAWFASPSTAPAELPMQPWKVDPVHSSVVFKVKHAGVSWFYGDFGKITGTLELAGRDSKLSVSIDAASIDTNSKDRDEHLKGPDFFDAKQFPEITYVSRTCEPRGDDLQIEGDLTLRGISREMKLTVRKTGEGEFHGRRLGYETSFVIKRSDFGMDYGVAKGVLGDEVTVVVAVEVVEGKDE